MPSGIGIIDTMMGVRPLDGRENARPRSTILPPPPRRLGTSWGADNPALQMIKELSSASADPGELR